MKSLKEKVASQLAKLEEFEPIYLWALFENDDFPDVWDIVFSSQGSDRNAAEAIKKISKHLVPELSKSDLSAISRIVVIPSEEPSVLALASAIAVSEGGGVEVQNCNFNGLQIKHAYVFKTAAPPYTRPNVQQSETAGVAA